MKADRYITSIHSQLTLPLYIYISITHLKQKSYHLNSLCIFSILGQMGFQDIVGGGLGFQYEKLRKRNEKMGRAGRHIWVKKMNGRLKGFKLSRSKKLSLKVFSVVVWPSRITRIYGEVVNRLKTDGVYPNIIFSTQWGLPVLSHSSVKFRESVARTSYARSCIK